MNDFLLTDRFIETEAVKLSGGDAEYTVWQSVKAAFTTRVSFGYWRFLVFSKVGQSRKEPDILLIDRQLGLEEFSPNPLPKLWEQSVLTFNRYTGRFEEVEALAERIKNDLEEGFKPSRDLLTVILGREFHNLGRMVAEALDRRQIDFYVPKASNKNSFDQDGDAGNFWHEGAVTLSSVIRAKGNEAEVVYVLCLDRITEHEGTPEARNQLFVALTRSRAFAHLSGVGNHLLYDEVEQVISSGSTFSFVYRKPRREITE